MHEDISLNHPIDFMRFTLIYDGPLHAESDNDKRTTQKHEIRRQLHGQLLDVWQSHPAVSDRFEAWLKRTDEEKAKDHAITVFPRGNYRFIPLLRLSDFLSCELDVLMLRREKQPNLINSNGDLDNRLKVRFDALRVPDAAQLPATSQPSESENPFFVLLEQDSLITGIRVDSERLQDAFTEPTRKNYVRLVMQVKVKVHRLTWANLGMGGD